MKLSRELKLGAMFLLIAILFLIPSKPITNIAPVDLAKTFSFTKEIDRQLNCLALNVYYEAGGEPYEGKLAVAQVTLNRVNHDAFPDTICDVVKQKTVVNDKTICQFSWICEKGFIEQEIARIRKTDSYRAAKAVLFNGARLPELADALYFHSINISPSWRAKIVAVIGGHVFYR